MHNKCRKNITVCFDYFYWHIILFNGRRCIRWINFPINILYFNSWKIKMPLMVFLYFYYTWMILKFPDSIIYWFVTYRLLRHKFTVDTWIFHNSLKVWLKCFSDFSVLRNYFPPSIRVILSLLPTLFEKKDFTAFRNCLLSVIFLTFRLLK